MRANQACSSGPLADRAKNGSPIEAANRPSSQTVSPWVGGRPHPLAIASGSANVATTRSATWTTTATRPGQMARQQMRIGVAGEQRRLEEHHRDRPDRRRAAEPRQHHLGEHGLDREQQSGGEENRRRIHGQDHSGTAGAFSVATSSAAAMGILSADRPTRPGSGGQVTPLHSAGTGHARSVSGNWTRS